MILKNKFFCEVSCSETGNSNIIQQFRELRSVFNSVYQKGDRNEMGIKQLGNLNVVGQAKKFIF